VSLRIFRINRYFHLLKFGKREEVIGIGSTTTLSAQYQ